MPVRLNTNFVVAHSALIVWQRLHDVEFVASCFPGATLQSVQPDGGFAGAIRIKLGPTTARFRGIMHVSYDEDARIATIRARGDDARRTKAAATATLTVAAADSRRACVQVAADIEVVGSLAQFAQTGGAEVTRLLLHDFAGEMEARLSAADERPDQADGKAVVPTPAGSSDQAASTGVPAIQTSRLIWRLIVAQLARLRQLIECRGDRR